MIEFNELKIPNSSTEALTTTEWNGLVERVERLYNNISPNNLNLSIGDKVGIGTENPSAKLEIVGGGGTSIDLKVNGRIQSNNNGGGLWIGGDRFVGGHSTNKVGIYSNRAWRLTVENNGEVGIGTISPRATLDVNGTIIAKSFGYPHAPSDKLITFRRFNNLGNNIRYNTGYKTADWNAGITGFYAADGDILENDAGKIIEVRMMRRSGLWHIYADFRSHRDHENWSVDVMFARVEISRNTGF